MRQFNDTDNLEGLVQMYEQEIGADVGFISGNTTRLKQFTAGTRTAWNKYLELAFKASGRWQFDDQNHTDYPIITTNLVDGQRDYPFTLDEVGNLILDIYKVAILSSASDTLYEEIRPVDQQTDGEALDITQNTLNEGVPYQYDKTANGIFLDPIPSYNATNGLRVWINRTASYFVSTDTTKRPGCPALHHDYFYLKPALEYARRNGLANYNRLREEVVSYEGEEEKGIQGSIERYFSRRERDERNIITPNTSLYI